MGELDCCQWLCDNEDKFNFHREDKVEPVFDLSVKPKNGSPISKDGNDRHLATRFGFIEFVRIMYFLLSIKRWLFHFDISTVYQKMVLKI